MNSIELLLNELDSVLQEYNYTNYINLQPPLTSVDLDEKLDELEIKNPEFRRFYEWKNGYNFDKQDNRSGLFKFGVPMPVESIFEYRDIYITQWKSWDINFTPLIFNTAGDFILFNNTDGPEHGKLHLFSASLLFVEEPISFYDSISTMIETTIKAYQSGIMKYNEEDNWLDIKIPEFSKLARAINPNSEYWNL